MAARSFHGELVLYWPTVIPPTRSRGRRGVVYFTSWDSNGVERPLCVSFVVCDGQRHALYANGTRARVVGWLDTSQNTSLLAASSISPVHVADAPADRHAAELFWPALLSAGVVSTGRLAWIQPRVSFHSLVVWDSQVRVGASCRIRCILPDVRTDEEVVLTGVVADLTATSVAVSVSDVVISTEFSMLCNNLQNLEIKARSQITWTPPSGKINLLPAVSALSLNDDGWLSRLGRPEVILRPVAPPISVTSPSWPRAVYTVNLVKDTLELKDERMVPLHQQDLPPGMQVGFGPTMSFDDILDPGVVKFDP